MGRWVCQITGLDTGTETMTTLLFARGRAISFTDHAPAVSGLISFQFVTQGLAISATGTVSSSDDGGEIILANAPRDIEEAGPWDHLVEWSWRGRVASLYYLPGRVWADRVLHARALLEQPVANLSVSGSVDSSLSFPLRDPRAELDVALQTVTYAGDNVAPDGVEGAADLKGKVKPIGLGPVSNFEADLVNPQRAIYQLNAFPNASVLCVRDGGLPLTASTSRGSLASIQDPANMPPSGGYDYYSGAEGLFVRLANLAQFKLTFDATTGSSEPDRTHAQVWKSLRTTYCGTDPGDIDAASVTALDTATPNEAGFRFTTETRRAAIDRVLASLSGYERQNLDGSWSIGRLEAPTGSAVINIVMVTPTTALKTSDRALTSLARARPSYAPDGAPPYRMNVRWGLNNTVMSPSDFAGAASQRLKTKFQDPWRIETDTDTSVWDPVANTGDFPNAPELTVDTGYQPGSDGLACPHAATEATRLLALYSSLKGQFEVGFVPKPGDAILPGHVVSLTYPGHGLDAGPKFVVLQSRVKIEGRIATASLLVGLQT